MRKITILLAFLFMLGGNFANAQTRTISGKVTSADDGGGIPGVTVLVKGTQVGTITDINGNYTLDISPDYETLVFRFVGMKTVEVPIGDQTNISIVMETDALMMDEVVVTAIGITRKAKALGYAATTVSGDDLNKAAPVSMMSSLQGKVAGVSIANTSGAPGASSSVIVRGYSSITGNNQPLYVVDGSPIENSRVGATTTNRSQDFGNAANDINPDLIESVTILKGASATALYGSRAANGAIIITTKKGQLGLGKPGKINVNFSTSADFSTPLRIPQLQNTFGQGWSGQWASNENGSWGPRLDGKVRPWGNVVDNSQLTKPFSAQENNLKDFYDIGSTYNSTISLSGGNEYSTFLFSYNNVNADGVVPTNADSYKRNDLSLKGSITNGKFTATGSANYVRKASKFVTTGQGASTGATMFQEIIQIPRDISIVDLSDYTNKFYDVDNYFTPYAQNPYFVLNENGDNFLSERFYGNAFFKYDFTSELSANARFSTDVINSTLKDWQAIAIPKKGTPNEGNTAVGGVSEQSYLSREFNSDVMVNYNKEINSDFNLNALVGWNVLQTNYRDQITTVQALTIPDFYSLSNSPNAPTEASSFYRNKRLYGIYGQFDLGFKDYLFLNVVARNDWSSTLPKGKNSFFYPGVGLSFVISDAIAALKESQAISFAKLRASWGMTGNDAPVYTIFSKLVPGNVGLGFGEIMFPIDGVSSFEIGNVLGNADLQPEITTEWEVGADLRFLQSRIGIDVAYYSKETDGQIMQVNIAASSGYTSRYINLGVVSNKGIELALNLVPIKTTNFTWDLTYTFTQNKSNVVSLPEGLEKYTLYDAYGIEFNAVVGQPLGQFIGHTQKYTDDGKVIVSASNGIPVNNTDKSVYGTSEPDYMMGLSTNFRFKNWNLGATLDYQKGGIFYSYTARLNYFVGNATNTLYNDRNPFIVPNSVIEIDNGDGTFSYEENTTPIDKSNINEYWNQTTNNSISREHMLDKTFLKLRELTLTYSLPQSMLASTPFTNLSITAFGRNLLMWTPEENNFIDPESTTYGNDLRGQFGEFAVGPTVRSFGVKLQLSF
ncbi:MAG: SusC/RagA family TonB-linked outer membrane protein [Bacteroidales bacterium]|jgi:TonB-linked SusC/RagA family outer membrane protein